MRNSIRGSQLLPKFCLWAIASLAPAVSVAESQYSLGAYCQMLEQMQSRYSGNQSARQSLASDHSRYCAELNWSGNANDKFAGEINPYISQAPDNLKTMNDIDGLADQTAAQRTLLEKYRSAREHASQMMTECHARAARAFDPVKNESQILFGLLNGTATDVRVNNGCNGIANYATSADSATLSAKTQCETIQESCRNMVNAVDESQRETRGQAVINEEMRVARSVAYNACNVMVDSAIQQGPNVAQTKRDLDLACTSARRRLADASEPRSSTPPVAKETPKTEKGTDFWSQAAGMLPQALSLLNTASETGPVDFGAQPSGEIVQNQIAFGGETASSMPVGAVKGEAAPAGVDRSGELIMDGDLMPGQPTSENKGTSRMSPNASAGNAGGAPHAGSGGVNAAVAGRKAGGLPRSRLDTEIYAGLYGSGSSRGSAFGGGGHRGSESLRGMGRQRANEGRGPKPVISVSEMNARFQAGMRKFLPTAIGRQPTVANTTGPDGITGPHSNLFLKVSRRYQIVPTSMGPSK